MSYSAVSKLKGPFTIDSTASHGLIQQMELAKKSTHDVKVNFGLGSRSSTKSQSTPKERSRRPFISKTKHHP